jgi:hypothetical protein
VPAHHDIPRRVLQASPGDTALAALATRQHGVVTAGQLRALGLGSRGIQHRVGRGRLHRLYPGVFAVGHGALTLDGRRLAAVLACGPGAALSHRSAAAAWGLRDSATAGWDVSTPRQGARCATGIRLHTPRSLPRDEVELLRAVPVTSVARTLVDLAAVLSADALGRALHQAEVLRVLDVADVDAVLARSNGRRGTGRLRRALATPSPGTTRSALEERFLSLCRWAGLPAPRCNVHLATARGLLEVDAVWPAAAVVVELDGVRVHDTARAFHADRRRDAALAAEGYVVVRLTWRRVTRERAEVAAELRRILAVRAGARR